MCLAPCFFRALSAAVLVGWAAPVLCATAPEGFDAWAERIAAESVRNDPNGATQRQYFEGAEQDALDRVFTSATREYRDSRAAEAAQRLEELARWDRASLAPDQRVSASLIEWHMKQVLRRHAFADMDFPFEQFYGLHVTSVDFLTNTHPLRTRRDAENYLARLGLLGTRIEQGMVRARAAGELGILMPDFITRSVLGQLDRFLAKAPRENVLVTSLNDRLSKVPSVASEERAALVAEATALTEASVIPAFERLRVLMREHLAKATPDAGLWRLPRGEEAYAAQLAYYTTTELSAREIHEIGLAEIKRLDGEMDALLRKLGRTEGSVDARFERLNAELQPPAEPDPRPLLLARYADILAESLKLAQPLFDLQPRAACEVRRVPSFTEATAAAHYTTPAKDGTRPGTFFVPLPGPAFKMLNMRTLTYHEAIPGHHFQLALLQEMEHLPRFRRDRVFGWNSANAEGWALYAERLAAEEGWYGDDLAGRLGQLEAERFRARRLVADTGLHVFRWTRQQAIDYGIPPAEVERYVMLPGQACSYKIGQLRILDLRAKAKAKLGERFSLREFHNRVLKVGVVPLSVLEEVIDAWIAEGGGPKA